MIGRMIDEIHTCWWRLLRGHRQGVVGSEKPSTHLVTPKKIESAYPDKGSFSFIWYNFTTCFYVNDLTSSPKKNLRKRFANGLIIDIFRKNFFYLRNSGTTLRDLFEAFENI